MRKWKQYMVGCEQYLMSPGCLASIEISYEIKAHRYAYLVHYTILFHSRGGYFNSLILQALELLPGWVKPKYVPSSVVYLKQTVVWWEWICLLWGLLRHFTCLSCCFNSKSCLSGGLSVRNGRNRSHFTLSQKVRATIGIAPTSQLPWWCYIENERMILERSGLIETPTLRGIAKRLREKA